MSAWAALALTSQWARMRTRKRWLWLDTIRTQWREQPWILPPPTLTAWLSKASTLSKVAQSSWQRNSATWKLCTMLAIRNANCSKVIAWCWRTLQNWDNSWQSTLTKNLSLLTSYWEALLSCSSPKTRFALRPQTKSRSKMKKKKISLISSGEKSFSKIFFQKLDPRLKSLVKACFQQSIWSNW